MEVSVVLPTYNERANITEMVDAVAGALDGRDFEVLVVDDGSPDGTAELVRDLQEERPWLRLMEREGERGLGAAYRDALPEARGGVVVQMDADFSHPPERIPALVAAVEEGADVAVGSRYVEGGDRNDPLHRRIFPLIGSFLYRTVLRSPVRDVTSGFKAYDRSAIDTVAADDLPSGFHFQAASLFRLIEGGAEVVEVPIDFRPRRAGDPKYSWRDLVDNALLLGRLAARTHHRPLKFGVVGGTGVAVDMGLFYLMLQFTSLYYLFAGLIATETAIIWNFMLNDLWTFMDRGEDHARARAGRFAKFQLVSISGLAIKLGFLYAFVTLTGMQPLAANLLAIVLVFVWNYAVNAAWTW